MSKFAIAHDDWRVTYRDRLYYICKAVSLGCKINIGRSIPCAERLRRLELDNDWLVGAGGRGLFGFRCTGVEPIADELKFSADIRLATGGFYNSKSVKIPFKQQRTHPCPLLIISFPRIKLRSLASHPSFVL